MIFNGIIHSLQIMPICVLLPAAGEKESEGRTTDSNNSCESPFGNDFPAAGGGAGLALGRKLSDGKGAR